VLDLNIQHLRPEPANRFVQKQVLVEVGSGYGPIDVAADQKEELHKRRIVLLHKHGNLGTFSQLSP
jgi:hypothetical protein